MTKIISMLVATAVISATAAPVMAGPGEVLGNVSKTRSEISMAFARNSRA